MNLNTLHDAFATLEERADSTHAVPPDFTVSASPARPSLTRFAAPVAAAAAVVSVAAGVTVWQSSQHSGPAGQPAHRSAAHGPSSSASAAHSSSAPPAHHGPYQPPDTAAKLTAKTRAILDGVATITVDPSRSSGCGATKPSAPPKPSSTSGLIPMSDGSCSGAEIAGTLTRDRQTAGFVLNVAAGSQSYGGAQCAGDSNSTCLTRERRNDGSTLAIGVWHSVNVPGGVTYEAQFVRPKGAWVDLVVSTMSDPKGQSPVITSQVPLSTKQLIAFVTSSKW